MPDNDDLAACEYELAAIVEQLDGGFSTLHDLAGDLAAACRKYLYAYHCWRSAHGSADDVGSAIRAGAVAVGFTDVVPARFIDNHLRWHDPDRGFIGDPPTAHLGHRPG